jgi:DeoR family transcriptional regulator, suf operon transcriptional repressor
MNLASAVLSGHRGLRGEILVALKMTQPLTARQLADRFGVSTNGLRRHLRALEDQGLVQYRRQVRGVGSPAFAFTLTDVGQELFPRSYDATLSEALSALRESRGREGVRRFFRRQWMSMAGELRDDLADLPLAERAQLLAELRSSQGYMAEAASEAPDVAVIREHNCALRAVAERFPELCEAEEQFFEEVLHADVRRRSHILAGCNVCEYAVQVRHAPAPVSREQV